MRELKGILHLGQKDRFYTSPQPYPVASRDVALKSKQEQKAKTIQQKGINLLLCARMCDRADIRRAEGLKNRRMIVSKDSFGHSSYISLQGHRGRRGSTLSLSLPVFSNPSGTACHLPYLGSSPSRGGGESIFLYKGQGKRHYLPYSAILRDIPQYKRRQTIHFVYLYRVLPNSHRKILIWQIDIIQN